MRTSRHLRFTMPLLVCAVLVSAPAAIAERAAVAIEIPNTPEARHGLWVQSLQDLLVRNPELTPEQAALVFEAQRAVEPRLFTDRLDEAQRRVLKESVDTLRTNLSCGHFAQVLDGFGPLRQWLEAAEVVEGDNCNCNDDSDCGGNKCQSVSCTSEAGTRHWGRCPSVQTIAGRNE